jgi:RNA polymerase sigma factor (sigma-70 family)
MAQPVLHQLPHLLDHLEHSTRDEAWTDFVEANSKLILYVARSLGGDHDDVMDRYAFVLEQLRRDNCHRLDRYAADGRGKFTTWLVVVVRRLCMDHRRQKYGRVLQSDDAEDGQRMRTRLVDLMSERGELDELVDMSAANPEERLRVLQLSDTLKSALASLDTDDRLLLHFRFEDDLSVREIARLMSCRSQFDVYRRLRQVLQTLRTTLLNKGVADPTP